MSAAAPVTVHDKDAGSSEAARVAGAAGVARFGLSELLLEWLVARDEAVAAALDAEPAEAAGYGAAAGAAGYNAAADAAADAAAQRAWWRASEDGVARYDGWAASRAQLVAAWRAEGGGGFDGILGFSQGAAVAAMLCAEVRPRFAVLAAGFVPRDPEAAGALLAGVEGVPSLHVIGRSDAIVETERSRALAALFAGADVVEHDGGHMLPSDAGVRRRVAAFLGGLDDAAPTAPPPPLGPRDAEWNDLEALQNEWALSDAIEQRNLAQLGSFVDADAQWAAQDEGDRWLLRRKPFVERRIDELRMQHGARETDP